MSHPWGRIQVSSYKVDPPRWEDLRVPFTAAQGGGVNDPVFTQFQDNGAGSTGVWVYSFTNVAERELLFTAQLSHFYKQGTDISAHVHWGPSSVAIGNVTWGLEWTIVNVNGGAFPLTTLSTVTVPTSGIDKDHLLHRIVLIPGAGIEISALIHGRIFRSTTGNTYAAPIWGYEIDFHYEMDNLGSNLIAAKTD